MSAGIRLAGIKNPRRRTHKSATLLPMQNHFTAVFERDGDWWVGRAGSP
jgi:hypothetical protein